MKYLLLLFLVVATLVYGCKKEKKTNGPHNDPLKVALMAHTWIQDSFVYPPPLSILTVVFEEPKDMTRFGENQYYSVAPSGALSNSVNYDLSDSGNVFFWDVNSQKNLNQYFRIESCTDKSLVVSAPTTGVIGTFVYYHAR